MRSSSASPGKSIGSGVPSTSTASFSMSWFRAGATEGRQTPVPKAPQGARSSPSCVVTDKLKSYAAAKREIMPGSSIASTKASIIGRKTPVDRHDDEADHEAVRVAAARSTLLPCMTSSPTLPRRRAHDTTTNLRSARTQAFATWADATRVAIGHVHGSYRQASFSFIALSVDL